MFEKIITRSFFAATFAAVALVIAHGIGVMPRSEAPAVAVVQLPTVHVTGRALGTPQPVVLAPSFEPLRRAPG